MHDRLIYLCCIPIQFAADDPDELIGPAVQGTTGILKSALKFGYVMLFLSQKLLGHITEVLMSLFLRVMICPSLSAGY